MTSATCGRLLKRVAARADDEDHQDLGCQRLDEPAGLEHRLARIKNREQYVEGQEVEERS